jgi:hypothetical protein
MVEMDLGEDFAHVAKARKEEKKERIKIGKINISEQPLEIADGARESGFSN